MAENKTQASEASVQAYLDAVEPAGKRDDARALAALVARVSGEPPVMWGPGIIGFGRVHYRYESGREGDTLRVGFAARKAGLVIYGLGPERQAALLARLGKHSTGKGCVYVKKLSDVDEEVLAALVAEA